jgi:predicted nucleic acid-binding Zn ribbon protein
LAAPDHRHCKVCGRVTGPKSETCSAECAATREQRLRAGRNYRYLLYGTIALILILFLSSYLR